MHGSVALHPPNQYKSKPSLRRILIENLAASNSNDYYQCLAGGYTMAAIVMNWQSVNVFFVLPLLSLSTRFRCTIHKLDRSKI